MVNVELQKMEQTFWVCFGQYFFNWSIYFDLKFSTVLQQFIKCLLGLYIQNNVFSSSIEFYVSQTFFPQWIPQRFNLQRLKTIKLVKSKWLNNDGS